MGSRSPEKMNNWDGFQYYFEESQFVKKIIKSGFIIVYQNVFVGWGNHESYLKFFHLKKANDSKILRYVRGLRYSINLFNGWLHHKVHPYGKIRINHFAKVELKKIISGIWHGVMKSEIKADKKGLIIALNDDPYVILRHINLPENLFIKIAITPPGKTTLQLFYNLDGLEIYKEKLSVIKSIGPNKSGVGIQLPVKGVQGRLRIDIGETPGKYIIYRLDIYSIIE